MNLTVEQLKEVEELASLFLDPDEIAVILNLDIHEFESIIGRRSGDVFLAYFRGKTISKKELHENVVKMAKRGSPQAEEMVRSFISKQTLAENRAKRKG
jgi:hypothetical protein